MALLCATTGYHGTYEAAPKFIPPGSHNSLPRASPHTVPRRFAPPHSLERAPRTQPLSISNLSPGPFHTSFGLPLDPRRLINLPATPLSPRHGGLATTPVFSDAVSLPV